MFTKLLLFFVARSRPKPTKRLLFTPEGVPIKTKKVECPKCAYKWEASIKARRYSCPWCLNVVENIERII